MLPFEKNRLPFEKESSDELALEGMKNAAGLVETGITFIPKALASLGIAGGAGTAALAQVLTGGDAKKASESVQEAVEAPFKLTSKYGEKSQKEVLDFLQDVTEGISKAWAGNEGWLASEAFKKNDKKGLESLLGAENRERFVGDIIGNVWMPGEVGLAVSGAKSKRVPSLTPEEIAKINAADKVAQGQPAPSQNFIPSGQQELPFERVNPETLPHNADILAQLREQALAEHEGMAQQLDMANQRATGQTNLFTENVNPVPRQETPLPALEQPGGLPRLPEQAMGETPLPFVPEIPNKYQLKTLPDEPAQRQLNLTPDDRPIPHVPNRQFENVMEATPESRLIDALLSKDIEAQRIRDMEANTRTNELRGQMDSIDFPLRPEVLEQPAIKEAIDNFRREAERLKDMPEQLAKLQEEFAAGMKQLGIDKASDAYGRALYEAGQGTKLPIEKQVNGVNKVARDEGGWSDFTRASMPPEPLGNRGKGGKFVPNSQRGMIDPKTFVEGFRKILGTKVVTPDGLPKIVYHGTSKDKDFKRLSPNTRGTWFTTKPAVASGYAMNNDSQGYTRDYRGKLIKTNTASRVIPAYLDIKNPKILDRVENQKFHNSNGSNYAKSQRDYIAQAKRDGYDGLISEDGELIVAFDKDQIHSAISGPLGQTAKGASQRGGRKDPLASNPEFIRFKNALPENMQGKAKHYWNYLQEQKRQKAEVETTPGKKSEDAVASIPGLNSIVEEVAPLHGRSVEEMVPVITSSPDTKMGMLARAWRTGAQLTGFEKKNVLIRYVGDIVNNAVRSYEVMAKNVLKDKEAGVITKIEALPMKERTQVREAMRAMEGKEGTIDMSLWSDKQKEAYTAYRKAMDDGFAYMNVVRKELGLKPAKYRPNYLPSRWDGDFLIPVYKDVINKDGSVTPTMVHALTAGTRMGVNNAMKKMRELHPEYNFGDVEYRSITQHSKDLEATQRSVMQMLADDDPRMENLQSVFEELLAAQTYGTQNFKKHFEAKRKEGMGGFEGGKEWLSPEQNTKEGFQSDMRYLEQLYKWGELQRAGQKINKLLSNPEVMRSQENAVKFAKNYWEGASGHGTKTAKVLDAVLDLAGEYSTLGSGNIRDVGKTLKTLMTLKFLGLGNIAYMGSQAWQPLQMAPAWMYYLEQKGAKANKAISEVKADLDSVAPMDMKSVFGKEASKWAHDNHIADSYILDEITDAGSAKMARSLESMAQYLTPAKIEVFSRYNAFMRYAHFLHDSGVPKMQALESAAKITDMSMTNYHMHERPMIYRNLGFVGDMASSFTTFKHNQWQQLNAFGRDPKRWKALTALVGMQLVSGGLMGLYARDEIDSVIKKLNGMGVFKDYIPTTREFLLRSKLPDWAIFGVVSAVTGLDMSSKFSAADVIPNGPMEAFLPFLNDWTKMAEGLGEMASRQSGESVRQFAHSAAPTSLKWTLEDPIAFGEKNGNATIDPQSDKGLAKRTPFDRGARMMGAYSIDEARQRFAVMEERNQTKWQADRSASILQKARDADGADISDLARQYEKLGGSAREITEALNGHKLDQFMSAFEREKGKNPTSTKQLLKAKRMQGYER